MSPEWLTTIMAFVALVFGIWQIRSSRADSREATAKQIWMEYYLRCIEYPKFANPELSKLDYKNQTLDGKKEKFFDYQWFVSFMLLACDEVIRLRGGAEWERFAENNVSYHRDYIKSPAFVESYHLFGPQLRSKIHQIREEKQTSEGPKKTHVMTKRCR